MKSSPITSDMSGKTLIVPACSATLVDNFAVDWIIQTLQLERVAVLSSEHVTPLVQPAAFSPTVSPVTTAVELYAIAADGIAVLQIRSTVVNKKAFSEEILEFSKSLGFAKVLVVGGGSAHMLSGAELETVSRIRRVGQETVVGSVIGVSDIHMGGCMKNLFLGAKNSTVTGLLALSKGAGFDEVVMSSHSLALAVLNEVGVTTAAMELKEPKSIRALLETPTRNVEVNRIL